MTATNPADQSGLLLAQQLLQAFGLPGSLINTIRDAAIAGDSSDELLALLYTTPEFNARFPAIQMRVQAGLPPLTATDYVNYERTAADAFKQYGLPLPIAGPEFNNVITRLLANDVSASELTTDRLAKAWGQLANAPAAVRQAAEATFGIHGDANLAALILDPTIAAPEIQKRSDAMLIAGTGNAQYGFNFTAQRATELARNTDAAAHLADFTKLVDLKPLFVQSVGEEGNPDMAITAEKEGAGAIFGEAGADVKIQRALDTRKAEFSGSSGQVVGQQGVLGAGVADRGIGIR